MSDIKRYDISYSERYGFDKEEDPNGEYVEWEDHAAAIAANDARIADLEFMLRGLGAMLATRFDAYSDHWRARINAALASQQRAEPKPVVTHMGGYDFVDATPSEDGGEVPEVVGHLLLGGYADQVELEDNDIELDMKIVERLQADQLLINGDGVQLPLMTVAQHSRIVSAKDAEIARLRKLSVTNLMLDVVPGSDGAGVEIYAQSVVDVDAKFSQLVDQIEALETERDNLRAQPARQVGGDERETAIAQFAITLPMTSESAAGGNTYDQELRRYYLLGWDDRAALAPAAVAVVDVQSCKLGNYGAAFDMPGDRRAFTYTHQPGNVGASRLGRAVAVAQTMPAGDSIDAGLCLLKALQDEGFGVFEIDIARLNRRAIPAAVVMPCRADERQSERYMNGWNSALDEVARLNRRAIPAWLLNELLRHIDKVTYMPFGEPMTPDDGERKKLSDELRALLGKS